MCQMGPCGSCSSNGEGRLGRLGATILEGWGRSSRLSQGGGSSGDGYREKVEVKLQPSAVLTARVHCCPSPQSAAQRQTVGSAGGGVGGGTVVRQLWQQVPMKTEVAGLHQRDADAVAGCMWLLLCAAPCRPPHQSPRQIAELGRTATACTTPQELARCM